MRRKRRMVGLKRFRLAGYSFLALICAAALARSEEKKPAPAETKPAAIVGATVHPVSRGPVRRATVLWRGGKIVAVGTDVELPEGTETVAGEGLHVSPGLVAVLASGVGIGSFGGDFAHSLDPFDLELRIALANGITTVHVLSGGFAGGFGRDTALAEGMRSAVIKLTAGDLRAMLVREPGAHFLAFPSRQIERNLHALRERFRRAREYLKKAAEAKAKNAKPPPVPRDIRLQVEILKNEVPVIASAWEEYEVRKLLELADEFGFDLVLEEPNGAWRLAAELAARRVPVLVKSRGPDFNFNVEGPVLGEEGIAAVRVPAVFRQAGVETVVLPYKRGISLSGLAGRDLSALALDAAYAVRGGMEEEEALRAITLAPSRVLRLAERIGSLEPGKDADIVLWSGHPLDYRSHVLKVWIGGKLYYDRQASRLYRQVPIPEEPRSFGAPEPPPPAAAAANR